MDHAYAAEHHLVEQYLLNEMSQELRDQFEDHYFGCPLCAAGLRSTAAFLEAAREELQKPKYSAQAVKPAPARIVPFSGSFLQWKPAFAVMALAACLLVIVYQNAVVLPDMRSQVAGLQTPEILPTLSLATGNSRGAAAPTAFAGKAPAMLLQFDIPGQEKFQDYTCQLFSPAHQLVWSGQVSAAQAKDTVSLRVPLASQSNGEYSLVVKGNQSQDVAHPGAQIATYTFVLNAGVAGSGH